MAMIKVCDDDQAFTMLLADFLGRAGHIVSVSFDVNQLAQALGHDQIDLLIVDMQMPGGGGPAAARLLEKLNAKNLAVIVCSGMPPEAQKAWFKGLTRIRFLQKPVELKLLETTVKEILA